MTFRIELLPAARRQLHKILGAILTVGEQRPVGARTRADIQHARPGRNPGSLCSDPSVAIRLVKEQ